MITESDILEQLNVFKVLSGTPVTVHSSLKTIGYINGGAETLISDNTPLDESLYV